MKLVYGFSNKQPTEKQLSLLKDICQVANLNYHEVLNAHPTSRLLGSYITRTLSTYGSRVFELKLQRQIDNLNRNDEQKVSAYTKDADGVVHCSPRINY